MLWPVIPRQAFVPGLAAQGSAADTSPYHTISSSMRLLWCGTGSNQMDQDDHLLNESPVPIHQVNTRLSRTVRQ